MPRDQQLVKTPAQLYDEWKPVGPHLLVAGRGIDIPGAFEPIDEPSPSKELGSEESQSRAGAQVEEVFAVHADAEDEVQACTEIALCCLHAGRRQRQTL